MAEGIVSIFISGQALSTALVNIGSRIRIDILPPLAALAAAEERYTSLYTCRSNSFIITSYSTWYIPSLCSSVLPSYAITKFPTLFHASTFICSSYATKKLNKLPTVNPPTSINPMKPPAASRSSTSTHSPAPIMHVEPRYPLLSPNKSCTTIK